MRRESDFDVVDIVSTKFLKHDIQGGIDIDIAIEQVLDDADELFADEYDDEKVAEVCYLYNITSFVYPENVRAEEIEGVSEVEKEDYKVMMAEVEINQGQTAVGTSVRFAISAMEDMWTIDDLVELSGASRDTVERVVEQEEIRDNCELIARAKTAGMSKGIYITHK